MPMAEELTEEWARKIYDQYEAINAKYVAFGI